MNPLRVGATVQGDDGILGKVDALVIDPTTSAVTHLVVLHERLGPRLLVPVDVVTDSSATTVTVSLDSDRIEGCARFDEPDFNAPDESWAYGDAVLDSGSYFLEPYATPTEGWILAEHERVPKGEITIRRADEVVTSDGTKVGHVDEFLIDPADGHITHVVLRKDHIFRRNEDVVIPVGAATEFEEGRVVLGLELPEVEALPKVAVHRHGHIEEPPPEPAG